MRAFILILLLLLPRMASAQQPLTVFAAASLTDAMHDIDAAWQARHHKPLRLSFGSSSTLARQIAEGAPVNVYGSADERWMNYLARRHDLAPGTRRDLLTNRLVLIVPASHPVHLAIGRHLNLAALLGRNGRLALGNPATVPAGIYAKQALKTLGLWRQVKPHLAPAEDVRAALLLVERGEAPAGIVYATDAMISHQVMVAGVFPASSHTPITYPFAVVKSGDTPHARAFLAFLDTKRAKAIFAACGFGVR